MGILLGVLGLLAPAQDAKREAPAAQESLGADPKRVYEAIRKGIDYLRKPDAPNPVTEDMKIASSDELFLLTFIGAGLPESDPDVQRCLKNILSAPFQSVYQVSLQAMVLEELDRARYQGRIWQCAQFLVDAQFAEGLWSYGERTPIPDPPVPAVAPAGKAVASTGRPRSAEADAPPKRKKPAVARKLAVKKTRDGIGAREYINNSSAMYAALGLRACHDAGIVIPREVIDRAVKWWLNHQVVEKKEKGAAATAGGVTTGERISWGYYLLGAPPALGTPTLSMTTGAVGSLVIYDYLMGADWKKNKAVTGGLNWIGDQFSVAENAGVEVAWGHKRAFHYYYLYALERLGVLYDTPVVGTHKWYPEGASFLLGEQKPNGSWNNSGTWLGGSGVSQPAWDTCFAVLFLKRATAPLQDVASEDRFIRSGSEPGHPDSPPK
jgi:hypothetical protein